MTPRIRQVGQQPCVRPQGLVYQGRSEGTNTPEKTEFARSAEDGARLAGASLTEAVAAVQPTALVGAAAAQKPFTRDVLQALTAAAEARAGAGARPIVLALSNPSDVAECTAQVDRLSTASPQSADSVSRPVRRKAKTT